MKDGRKEERKMKDGKRLKLERNKTGK